MRDDPISAKRMTELDIMSLTIICYVFGYDYSIPIDVRKIAETLAGGDQPEELACGGVRLMKNPEGEHYKYEEEEKLACLIGCALVGNPKFEKCVFPDDWKPDKREPTDLEVLYFAEGLLLPWRRLCPFIADTKCFNRDIVSDTFMAPKEWVARRMDYIFSDWRMIDHLNESFFDELKSLFKEDVECEKQFYSAD